MRHRMFCSQCGVWLNEETQFCRSCGAKTRLLSKKQAENKSAAKATTKDAPKSFNDFLKCRIKVKCKKKQEKVQEVTVYVSMLRRVNNTWRQISGSRTPVTVAVSADYEEVKKAAFSKLKRYVPEMHYDYCEVELCYRSGGVALFLPGILTEFSLQNYKNDLGVKFSQIVLYLKPYENENSDHHSDSEPDTINMNQPPAGALDDQNDDENRLSFVCCFCSLLLEFIKPVLLEDGL